MKLLLASALLLTASAPDLRAETPAFFAIDAILFRVSSWGKPVSEWKIRPNGAAIYTHAEGPGLGTRLVTRKFDVGPQGFARIRTLLAPAEKTVGAQIECGERRSDFPYGSVRWAMGSIAFGLAFDLGCENPQLQPVHDAVDAAEKQMADWSKNGQIIEDKEMTP